MLLTTAAYDALKTLSQQEEHWVIYSWRNDLRFGYPNGIFDILKLSKFAAVLYR